MDFTRSLRNESICRPWNEVLMSGIYYCYQCKLITNSIDDLLFVEEKSKKSFCCEKCIQDFYQHLIGHFENLEFIKRKELNLENENLDDNLDNPELVEEFFKNPDQSLKYTNEIGEEITTIIKKIDSNNETINMLVNCFTYSGEISLILHSLCTKSNELISLFSFQSKKFNENEAGHFPEENLNEVEVDQKMIDEIELKKSTYLAELMEERKETDIPIESFHLYENFFSPTLYEPDEIYSYIDQSGDEILSYIRAHEQEGKSFYYLILCLKGDEKNKVEQLIYPIVSFPTVDGKLAHNYRKGEMISGSLKN